MHKHFIQELVCPKSSGGFTYQGADENSNEILSGQLMNGETVVPIVNGIPDFLGNNLAAGEQNVHDVFSELWKKVKVDYKLPIKREWYLDGLAKTLMFDGLKGETAEKEIKKYLNGKQKLLDAGCGQAWVANYYRANEEQQWYNVDIGEALHIAQREAGKHPNNFIARASINELPFPKDFFDFIISMGVLHHMPNPKEAFKNLVSHLKPGGDFFLGLIRKQPPLRDFADSYSRQFTTKMGTDEGRAFSKSMCLLAKELQKHNITLNVPDGLQLMGIDPGEYSLHRFVHVNFMKCVYAEGFSEEENIQHNLDWYAPEYAWAHTEEELLSWFEETGFTNLETWKPATLGEKNQMVRIKGTKR